MCQVILISCTHLDRYLSKFNQILILKFLHTKFYTQCHNFSEIWYSFWRILWWGNSCVSHERYLFQDIVAKTTLCCWYAWIKAPHPINKYRDSICFLCGIDVRSSSITTFQRIHTIQAFLIILFIAIVTLQYNRCHCFFRSNDKTLTILFHLYKNLRCRSLFQFKSCNCTSKCDFKSCRVPTPFLNWHGNTIFFN